MEKENKAGKGRLGVWPWDRLWYERVVSAGLSWSDQVPYLTSCKALSELFLCTMVLSFAFMCI
jgi:hypothetical protein